MNLQPTAVAERPDALLELLRATSPQDIPRFRADLEREVLGEKKDVAARPGAAARSSRLRAQLSAYLELLEFEQTGSVKGLAHIVPEAILQLKELFKFTLRFDVARKLIEKYVERWPSVPALNILPPVIGSAAGPVDDFRDDNTLDLQIVPAPGATTTVVVFCGVRHAFGIQLNVLHHCVIAKHGVNVVYVRDFAQNLYLTGIQSMGGLQETIGGLRKVLADLGTKKTATVGNSAGVFAALFFGARLPADLVLLFSGPSSLEIGLEETERQVYPRLFQLREEGKIEWPDIRETYAACDVPVQFYYGEQNRFDRSQAENLAGLPHVRLCPLPATSHFVLDQLAASGELDRIFAAAAAPVAGAHVRSPA